MIYTTNVPVAISACKRFQTLEWLFRSTCELKVFYQKTFQQKHHLIYATENQHGYPKMMGRKEHVSPFRIWPHCWYLFNFWKVADLEDSGCNELFANWVRISTNVIYTVWNGNHSMVIPGTNDRALPQRWDSSGSRVGGCEPLLVEIERPVKVLPYITFMSGNLRS